MTHRSLRTGALLSVTAALALVMAGCGSDSEGTSSSSSSGGTDTSAAQEGVAKYEAPMTSVDLPKLSKTPETGKKIVVIVNNLPESQYIKEGVVSAAEVLGWTAVPIVYDVASPTGVTAAFEQAVSENPDGVVTQAINATDYAEAAQQLADKGIPVVTSNTTDPVKDPIVANVTDAAQVASTGRLAADYVYAQQGDKASVAMFNIPSFPILTAYEDAFKDELAKLCPDCHYESHPVQAADIGTKVPTQVVSAVQRTPSINFAAMGFGAVATGVSGALASAGLSDVKVIGIAPTTENLTAVDKGTEDMWVALPITTIGWKSVDALARYFNGDDVEVATTAETPRQIIVQDNAAENLPRPEVGNYEDVFKELWLVN